MEIVAYSVIASLAISLMSFIGIISLLNVFTKYERIVTALISFAAGTLIGDAFLHLLPENIEEYGYTNTTALLIFIGIILMLGVEAYLHCSHDSAEELEHHKHILPKMNIIGDGIHNFLDGIAVAAAFLISPASGVATTIAICLHEIPQEFADVAILKIGGWSRKKIIVFNFITALTAVIGVIFALTIDTISEQADKYLVPIVVGQFIYIALADLVPEIHKKININKYFLELVMFLLGLVVMYGLTMVE